MAKFMVLYSAETSATELMDGVTSEQMQVSMKQWMDWFAEAGKTAKVEFGLPLQTVANITSDSQSAGSSNISGYSTIEADSKDVVVELLKNHPHLMMPGASIELLEMLPMPGM